MEVGFIGLGRMGGNMVRKLLRDAHEVFVWNRSAEKAAELRKEFPRVYISATIDELVKSLSKPRVLWMMLPAGEATTETLQKLEPLLEEGDIIVDGGNANFNDTQKRYDHFKSKGIRFLGVGVSGGIIAAQQGYPLMVGGDQSAYEEIISILDTLGKPMGGHDYFGEGGAGHFVKMVHNGIEYGIMQSLGEGFGVLEKAKYNFDLLKIARLWQKGTLVSGFMLDRSVDALEHDPKLENLVGVIAESGEAKWTVEQAKKEGVDAEIIERSLEFRRRSQKDKKVQESFAARMVASLRNAFGGHEVTKK